jgi:dihydrofolate reductase
MKVKVIAAMGSKRELGYKNDLPGWNLPTDLARFKKLTSDKIVTMGQNTFFSLPPKWRPLPGRKNVVLTLDKTLEIPGVQIVHSIPEILETFASENEIWIMGGASIYKQFVPLADELHITYVQGNFQADVFFPEFENLGFKKISETFVPKDEKNSHNTVYTIYTK